MKNYKMTNEDISIACVGCKKNFNPPENRLEQIKSVISLNKGLVILKCPYCDISNFWKPIKEIESLTYRCPVSSCSGWVSVLDDGGREYLGCGECGSLWYEKKSFQKEVTEIQNLFPYRVSSYRRVKDKWFPADIKDEAKNYEDLVESEPKDSGENFVRG